MKRDAFILLNWAVQTTAEEAVWAEKAFVCVCVFVLSVIGHCTNQCPSTRVNVVY